MKPTKSNHPLQLASGHPITVSLETITPETAAEWLKLNVRNRKPRPRQIEILRREMAGGAWQFTHQGIAFGEAEPESGITPLLDGQHRLHAIVASGATLNDQIIFRNLPHKAQEATDMGQARSTAENLHLFDGEKNASTLCALVNSIARDFAHYDNKVSLPQTREIIKLFPRLRLLAINTMAELSKKRPAPFRQLPVLSICGLALHKWPQEAASFHDAYQKGLNLTDTHPAYHLRNHCVQIEGASGYADRQKLSSYAADCLQQALTGPPMESPKPTGTGYAWLRKELGPKYTQLRTILRLV